MDEELVAQSLAKMQTEAIEAGNDPDTITVDMVPEPVMPKGGSWPI